MQETLESKLVRACLAALARRAGKTGLVVSYDEIDYDFPDEEVTFISDEDAKCVRITPTSFLATSEVKP